MISGARVTYNVLVETLNPAESINLSRTARASGSFFAVYVAMMNYLAGRVDGATVIEVVECLPGIMLRG